MLAFGWSVPGVFHSLMIFFDLPTRFIKVSQTDLNQASTSHKPACTCFLKIASVRMSVCVCVCIHPWGY